MPLKNINFVFIGSESSNVEYQKTKEKLLKKERALYSKYRNMKEIPSILQLDKTRTEVAFKKIYQNYFDLSKEINPKWIL